MSARVIGKLVWTFLLVLTLVVASTSTTDFVYAAF